MDTVDRPAQPAVPAIPPPPPENLLPDKSPSRRERMAARRRARAARRAVEAVHGADLTSFQRFLAVLGIIFGFFLLLTIPGWLGIRAWGRYRRGEPSSIRSYMWFGGIAGAVLLATVPIGILSDASSQPSQPVAAESGINIPSISPVPDFSSEPSCDRHLVNSVVRDAAYLHEDIVAALNTRARSGTWRTRPARLVDRGLDQILSLETIAPTVNDSWWGAMRAEAQVLRVDVEVLNAVVGNVSTARLRAILSRDRTASNRARRLIGGLTPPPC